MILEFYDRYMGWISLFLLILTLVISHLNMKYKESNSEMKVYNIISTNIHHLKNDQSSKSAIKTSKGYIILDKTYHCENVKDNVLIVNYFKNEILSYKILVPDCLEFLNTITIE